MKYCKYVFTRHALERMKERNIHRKQVIKAIENYSIKFERDGHLVYLGTNGIEVVANQDRIITVIPEGNEKRKYDNDKNFRKNIKQIRKFGRRFRTNLKKFN